MKDLFSLEYGVAGFCVLFTISIFVRLFEFVWNISQKKESISEASIEKLTHAMEENTRSLNRLDSRIRELELMIPDISKLKMDVRRFYTAIRVISGDNWSHIRDEILKDDLSS